MKEPRLINNTRTPFQKSMRKLERFCVEGEDTLLDKNEHIVSNK
jgi:hypothetical protein